MVVVREFLSVWPRSRRFLSRLEIWPCPVKSGAQSAWLLLQLAGELSHQCSILCACFFGFTLKAIDFLLTVLFRIFRKKMISINQKILLSTFGILSFKTEPELARDQMWRCDDQFGRDWFWVSRKMSSTLLLQECLLLKCVPRCYSGRTREF